MREDSHNTFPTLFTNCIAGANNPFYGKCHDVQTKRIISESKKGKRPPNYGIPMSEKQKRKISENRTGKGLDRIPWNKGIPTTVVAKAKISLANKGRKHTKIELAKMRICNLNEHAFDIETEESSYWIGVLMADGNVCYKKDRNGRSSGCIINLTMQEDDIEHLHTFQRFMGSSHKLYYRVNNKTLQPSISYQLSFSSELIATSLEKYGFIPRKSLIAKVKILDFNRHFWRGVIDGDGSISVDSFGRPWIKLVGSFEMVCQFKLFLEQELVIKMPKVYRTGSIYRIVITCATCIRVVKLLYENICVALDRKRVGTRLFGSQLLRYL